MNRSRSVSWHVPEKVGGLANGQRGHVGDRPVRDRHRQDLGLQPGALTGWAGHLPHVALVLFAGVVAIGLGVPALDPRDDTLVAGVVRAIAAVAVPVPDMHLLVQAVQDGLLRSSRESLPRRVQVEAFGVGHTLQQPQEVFACLTTGPRRNRPVAQGGLRIGDDELRDRPPFRVPSPVQTGQAPNGELNENDRGSSSSMASG